MSYLMVDGVLVLAGPVRAHGLYHDDGGFSPEQVNRALMWAEGDIVVRINSAGGNVFAAAAIHSAFENYAGAVTMIVEGVAASAGSLIAMAGDKIEMSPASMMMIHDPELAVVGNPESLEGARAFLDKLADTYAAVYAARAGIEVSAARALMKAETWYTPSEAVEAGFADTVGAEPVEVAVEAAAMDYTMFLNAPKSLCALSAKMGWEGKTLAAFNADLAAKHDLKGGPKMSGKNNSGGNGAGSGSGDVATLAARALMAEMSAACVAVGLGDDIAVDMFGRGLTMDAARVEILDKVAERGNANAGPEIVNGVVQVTADAFDRFTSGAVEALMVKTGLSDKPRNEFASMSLYELGRATLDAKGLSTGSLGRMEAASAFFCPQMVGGQHGTSDFGDILSNVANKSMLRGVEEAGETFQDWTRAGSLSDFKVTKRVGLDGFGNLPVLAEGAEYQHGTMGNHGESMVLATYGKMFGISRQAIINDDLDAFSRIPRRMGKAAIRTVGNLAYAVLTGNPNMSDGIALFHADHKNLAAAGSLPTAAAINAAIEAMSKQKERADGDEVSDVLLNVRAKYIIGGPATRAQILSVLNSEHDPDQGNKRAYNTARDAAEHVWDARITDGQWFMAADPAAVDTIEVAYLDGNQTPFIEQSEGWTRDGAQFKVRIDAAVAALAFQTLYKNAGA